ncbi:hypothetical protein HDU88_001450 [Geranomyces variabilis]|nr:hypothetical protein HDU88_001450 [Geranomyces variabilis]
MGPKRTTQPETPTTTPQKRRRTPASSASQSTLEAFFTPTRPSGQATPTNKTPAEDEIPTAVLAGDQFPWWETWPPKHQVGTVENAGVTDVTAASESATPIRRDKLLRSSRTQAKLEDLVKLLPLERGELTSPPQMHTFSLRRKDGGNHALDVGADGTGSIVLGRKTFDIVDKRVSRTQVQLEYDSRNGKVWIQQLGANDSFLQLAGAAPRPLGKSVRSELFHNDRFWLLENIEPFDLKVSPVPVTSGAGQKRAKPEEEVDEDETTDDEQPPPPPAKKRNTKPRATKKKARRTDSASGSDDDSYYDPDDPTFVVGDDEDDDEEFAGSEVGEEEDEDDRLDKPQVCMYGKQCYRKNEVHFQQFAHPWLDDPAGPASRPVSTPGASRFGSSSKSQPSSGAKNPHAPSVARKSVSSGAQSPKDIGRHSSPSKNPHAPSVVRKSVSSGAQSPKDISRHSSPSKVYNPPPNSTNSSSLLAGAPSSDDVKLQIPASLSPPSRDAGSDTPNRFRIPTDYSPAPASSTSKPAPSSLAASYAKAFPTQKPSPAPSGLGKNVSDVDPVDRVSPTRELASVGPQAPPVKTTTEKQDSAKETYDKGTPANGHNNPQTIAFPSLATREGQLDFGRAAAIFADTLSDVYDTLSSRNISLVLVDEDEAVVAAYTKAVGDKPRFRAMQGDLSTIFTSSGVKCDRIVVETSWRWKTTATATCHRVHNRAGSALIEKTRVEYADPAALGKVYPVTVPQESALHVEEGIKEVLYVVGPNLNPLRANCLASVDEALSKLRASYTSIFQYALNPPRLAGNVSALKPSSTSMSSLASPSIRHASGGSWADALKPYCLHPEKHPDVVVAFNDDLVAMKDKFPARKHYLVMPRADIESLSALDRSHVRLLDAMKAQADELIAQAPGCRFRTGFHAVPSMRHLHMHVISEDFDSPALKNKKHWNSFTSPFFKNFQEVRALLETTGAVVFDKATHEEMLKGPLLCHVCKKEMKTIPTLKEHIKVHI